MKVWVTSLRRGSYDRAFCDPVPEGRVPVGHEYVGRSRPGYVGSLLANPFRLGDESERDTCLARYSAWLATVTDARDPRFVELLRLYRLATSPQGVKLACWCAPLRCHGEAIRAYLGAMASVGW